MPGKQLVDRDLKYLAKDGRFNEERYINSVQFIYMSFRQFSLNSDVAGLVASLLLTDRRKHPLQLMEEVGGRK